MIDVLLVEDDADLREAIADMLEVHDISFIEAENGHQAQALIKQNNVAMVLSDVQMSPGNGYQLLEYINTHHNGTPVILMTAYGSIPQAVDAIQAGAVDYLVKPFEVSELVRTLQQQLLPSVRQSNEHMIAEDPLSLQLTELALKVAQSEATVLLNGESGVGKEVISQFIHQSSSRNKGPFVAINCAAIPENMLESALFGYEKGAFTGAVKSTIGKFEQAQGGTLLLDEISEMDLVLQAKLLRVIQERQVERLGGTKLIDLDVRIIATTNRDLKKQVAEKLFREDLFYRLNVFPLTVPSLRQRPLDIIPIAVKLLTVYNRAAGQTTELTEAAKQILLKHQWPGNVRELDNVIQRAMILKRGNEIQADDIMLEVVTGFQQSESESDDDSGQLQNDLRDRETEVILDTLKAFNGSRKQTAEKLGISPRTLRYKLARLRDTGAAIPD
ncbi:MAG: sigma-54-dependent Fis family transcriptional regulator [Gammaproteobacteria bacterium]|jgi:two-component system response regulator FlrC|nr:sigma-54-dependent Fis family transcriptional regulator [Gammaproteobacteria bacterium]MBT4448460.1 sigma-54-dependent Fis family transcriptional regulator [Gammaproteobacteria bacterium]MBT4862768.1 sigma-54-dependent Fis family transcriptional regulator [Gammaproteobacteria bacterium]MBT6550054.1 sigma-54-dependent Fis family transcriptional regulator [Gammaproteobacteria bacterium]